MSTHATDVIALASNLRRTREVRKIGTRELARKAGVQPSTITRIEQGENPSLESVVRLARALNLALDDLVLFGDSAVDMRIHGPIGDAYAEYDSDPRAHGPEGFSAFADAVGPLVAPCTLVEDAYTLDDARRHSGMY